MSDHSIRVLIVDDHEIVRKSIQAMLVREPGIKVVGTAVNGRDAIQQAQELTPDVIIMDVSMPVLDGIRAAGELQSLGNASQVIILSMHHSNALLQRARKNGVVGYIMKQQANRDLIPAIRAAVAGELSI